MKPITTQLLGKSYRVWEHFHKTHDEQNRNTLMEHYRYLVRYTAERLHTKLPGKVELDDLIAQAHSD